MLDELVLDILVNEFFYDIFEVDELRFLDVSDYV